MDVTRTEHSKLVYAALHTFLHTFKAVEAYR